MTEPVKYTCFIGGESFEWSHDTWGNGRLVPEWKVMICKYCDQLDGVPAFPELLERLAENGIKPTYDSRGFIVLPR